MGTNKFFRLGERGRSVAWQDTEPGRGVAWQDTEPGRGVAWQDTEQGRGRSPIASSWMDIDAQTLQRRKYFSR